MPPTLLPRSALLVLEPLPERLRVRLPLNAEPPLPPPPPMAWARIPGEKCADRMALSRPVVKDAVLKTVTDPASPPEPAWPPIVGPRV